MSMDFIIEASNRPINLGEQNMQQHEMIPSHFVSGVELHIQRVAATSYP